MSNGIGANPLNAISKVYLEQIAEKKDDSYLEPDMKKRQANNEKARKEMEKVPGQKNPHFEEKQQGWDAVNSLADVYKNMTEEGMHRDAKTGEVVDKAEVGKTYYPNMPKKKTSVALRKEKMKEGLDPVGKEDGDVNNDGKKDSTDSYLMKRRKAIGKAIKSKMSEGVRDMDPEKGTAERKARLEKKRGMKMDDHPEYKKEDVDNVDEMYKGKHGQTEKQYQDSRSDAGKMVSGDSKMSGSAYSSRSMRSTGPNPAGGSRKPEGQGRMTSGARTDLQFRKVALKKKAMKEELSSWRQDLSEIMTDDIDSKPIKEKKNIKNTIKINPKLGESVEELGGEILEMVEVDQFDGIIEEVFQDLLSEGYSEQLVRDAIEEATVTMGHDSYGPQKEAPKAAERTRDKLKKKAKGFLAKVAVKAYNKARDAKAAATPAMQRAKTSAKRGIRKAALKVADKLKEETVDEAVYGGAQPEKKDTRMTVTNADKKANTLAYQKYKAGDKRYKAADHMNEDAASMSPQEIALQKRKSTIDQMIARKRRQELDQGKKEQPAKAMGEEASDAMKDRRMERGGVAGNVDYSKPPKNTNNEFGKKKPSGMSALDAVKAQIRAKHGQGAIIDTKKK